MTLGLIAWLMFSAGIGGVFGAVLLKGEGAATRIGAGAGAALILGSVSAALAAWLS